MTPLVDVIKRKVLMTIYIVIGVIILGVLGYIASVYNTLQSLKTKIEASIQEIGNQLKRQASLIPNLESAVKGYLKHEKGIFEMLAEARKTIAAASSSGSSADMQKALDSIQQLVPQIAITVEDNPELKSDATVTNFMNELRDTADKLMYARRLLIDLTQRYNQLLVTFPSNLVASLFKFGPEEGLVMPKDSSATTVSSEDMKEPIVNLEK
ncbi:MAG: LemA family protein [Pseudomonadales bacterium]|nr:LemA family protein [Candidatus Woesebacteria bacterium]MCB9802107.1 LemA family protein [Pseudomonadales bacterium]